MPDVAICGEESSGSDKKPPVKLSDEASQIHSRAIVIDGHNDLPWELRQQGSLNFEKLDISIPFIDFPNQCCPLRCFIDIPRIENSSIRGHFMYNLDDAEAFADSLKEAKKAEEEAKKAEEEAKDEDKEEGQGRL